MRALLTSVVLPIVLGTLAAFVATKVFLPGSTPSEARPGLASASDPHGSEAELAELRHRVQSLESAPGVRFVPGTALPAPADAPQEAPPSLEAALEADREWANRLERSFAEEPVDASWAREAEADYRSGLEDDAEVAGFDIRSLECRSSRCRAVLEILEPGMRGLEAAHHAVMVRQFEHNCTTSIYTPAPEQGGDLSEAFVHWECDQG